MNDEYQVLANAAAAGRDGAGVSETGGSAASAVQPDSERYFRMGAAVAVAGLVHSGELQRNSSLRRWARGYLASFGVSSLRDVSDLGIGGVYQHDFEALLS